MLSQCSLCQFCEIDDGRRKLVAEREKIVDETHFVVGKAPRNQSVRVCPVKSFCELLSVCNNQKISHAKSPINSYKFSLFPHNLISSASHTILPVISVTPIIVPTTFGYCSEVD